MFILRSLLKSLILYSFNNRRYRNTVTHGNNNNKKKNMCGNENANSRSVSTRIIYSCFNNSLTAEVLSRGFWPENNTKKYPFLNWMEQSVGLPHCAVQVYTSYFSLYVLFEMLLKRTLICNSAFS